VCFNITESGLPDAGGWLLLVGQPAGMIGVLLVGWGREVGDSVRHLATSLAGRVVLAGTCLAVVAGLALAGLRIAEARIPAVTLTGGPALAEQARVDRPWPSLPELVDQTGAPFTLTVLAGRPAMITFAFGHCETVCPAVVHQARAARETMARDVSIVVFTLDPWRDTPARLGPMLRQFGLDPVLDHVVGGEIGAVEAALDSWEIARERNERSGDIVHPSLIYLVETDGTVAYASGGALEHLTGLAERLGWRTTTQ